MDSIDLELQLGKYLKVKKNVRIFKNAIESMDLSLQETNQLLYELCCDLSSKTSVKQCYIKLRDNKFGYGAKTFDCFREAQKEQDEFITSPAEVEEGVLECVCGSKRTVSFTLQTRSGDESTSVWARCVVCGKKWRA